MAETVHCVNCFFRIRSAPPVKTGKLNDISPEAYNLVTKWTHPLPMNEDCPICPECYDLALAAVADPEKAWGADGPPRGHENICISCGRSTLRIRTCKIISEKMSRVEQLRYARIAAVMIAPRKLKPNDQMCRPCYQKMTRKHPPAPKAPITELNIAGEGDNGAPIDEKPDIRAVKMEQLDPLQDFDDHVSMANIKTEVTSDNEQDFTDKTTLNELPGVKKEIYTECVHSDFTTQQKEIIEETYHESNAHLLTEDSVNIYTTSIKQNGTVKVTEESHEETEENDMKRKQNKWQVMPKEAVQEEEDKERRVTVPLPSIRRAPKTRRCCIFPRCSAKVRKTVPKYLRIKILCNFKYYIPSNSIMCLQHLESNSFEELCNSSKKINSFTPEQIEDMVLLLSQKPRLTNFEAVDEMEEDHVDYWTGLTKEMFAKILSITKLHDVNKGSVGLAALLCKLRTDDTNERLVMVFEIPRRTLEGLMLLAKEAIKQHPECIDMICSRVFSKSKIDNIRKYFGPKIRTEAAIKMAARYKRKKMLLASLSESNTVQKAQTPEQTPQHGKFSPHNAITTQVAKKRCKKMASNGQKLSKGQVTAKEGVPQGSQDSFHNSYSPSNVFDAKLQKRRKLGKKIVSKGYQPSELTPNISRTEVEGIEVPISQHASSNACDYNILTPTNGFIPQASHDPIPEVMDLYYYNSYDTDPGM